LLRDQIDVSESSRPTEIRTRNGAVRRIYLYPNFSTQDELDDVLARIAWYFTPFLQDIASINLWAAAGLSLKGDVSDKLDPEIAAMKVVMAPLFDVCHDQSQDRALRDLDPSNDVLLVWQKDAANSAVLRDTVTRMRAAGRYFEVDSEKSRSEGSLYLWAGLTSFTDQQRLAEECRQKFLAFVKGIPQRDRCYVFGTGPSLSKFAQTHLFSDGICLATNSMVRNKELLDKLDPVAIVAADPIFHAGCSRYAAAFRRNLLEVMTTRNCFFFTALRDYPVYLSYLPKSVRDRVIGVPFDAKIPYNVDLLKNFCVNPKANILTLLLLPIAGTISKEVAIVGCDGRPLKEKEYFWGHDKASQFNDEMENIKKVHPGFFAIDYNDYYLDHCKTTEIAVEALEDSNRRVVSLTKSYVPVLAARHPIDPASVTEIISINPDAVDDFGHFLSYDGKLFDVCKEQKISFKSLVSKVCEDEIVRQRAFVEPAFTARSWTVGRAPTGKQVEATQSFQDDLRAALAKRQSDPAWEGARLYMYCGSLRHAVEIEKVLTEFPSCSACINLFWISFDDYSSSAFVDSWREAFQKLALNSKIALTAPTQEVSDGLSDAFGLDLPVAPHPSPTFSDADVENLLRDNVSSAPEKLRVLFPSGMSREKGFAESVDAGKMLSTQLGNTGEVVVRALVRPNSAKDLVALSETIELDSNCKRSSDVMTDNQFADFIKSGDIIVLPYCAPDFSERTSGLLIDALMSAQPVVVCQGTWLANIASKYDFGIVVPPHNAEAICKAVQKIAGEINLYRNLARRARERYFRENSWSSLRDSVIKTPTVIPRAERPTANPRRVHAQVDETKAVAYIMRHLSGQDHVMVDVGAHNGSSAAEFSKLGWTIVCFEPDPKNRTKLQARWGNSKNITIDPRAVSSKAEVGRAFYSSEESTGISGMLKFRDTHEETAKVDVTTIGAIIDEYSLKKINFLKIDVEGYDFEVIKGVPWDLTMPEVIECEFEDAKTLLLGHTWRDIAEFLRIKGYSVYLSEWHPIIQYGVAHDWRRVVPYPEFGVSSKSWGNIIAFRKDPGFSAVIEAFNSVLRLPTVEKKKPAVPLVGSSNSHKKNAVTPTSKQNEPTADRSPSGSSKGQKNDTASKSGQSELNYQLPEHNNFNASEIVDRIRRFWRHNPMIVAVTIAGLIGALAGIIETAHPLKEGLWFIALFVAVFGLGGLVLKKALRRKLTKFDIRLEDQRSKEIKNLEARLRDQHATQIKNLQTEFQNQHTKQIELLASEFKAKLTKVEAELVTLRSEANVFDLMPVLRFLNLLRGGESALDALRAHPNVEHGHAVLMAVMTELERAQPGSLSKKCLVEIGTTRERLAGQGSTEKLAIFTAFLGMKFVTVDIDPINTKRIAGALRYLNPDAKAITARGENFLKFDENALDFVYLDAFDYDHGKHSQQRQDRYRELLQTDINDEACWKMHEACARAITMKMRIGGIVVIDDTWKDADGAYLGKGKLALPLLLGCGFAIIAKTQMTIALRRTEIKKEKNNSGRA